MLGQSRRGVNPRSGQVTVQTQPPVAGQGTNPTSAPDASVFLQKAERVHSFLTKLEGDREIYITGLAIDKEHIFVVYNLNNRTKVFTHEGQFKFDIKVNKPWDVAVSQTGHLYITLPGDSCVQVYSTRGQQVTTMGQGLLEWPYGITLDRQGHVMVCDCLKMSIFTFHADSGHLLNTIPLSMCRRPMYITVNSLNDNIVISDWRHYVHVLSPTGDHLYQYNGSREGSELRTPCGVCTDSYGHIFIADYGNNRIVALSPQGQIIRYIVTKDDGLKLPRAVVINPAGQLVVGEWLGNVKTFTYIQLKQGQFSEEINRQDPLLQEAYKRACKDGFERVKRARVMLLGHYGAGKTHLRKRLLGKEYDEDKDPITNGIETDYVLVKEGWNSDEAECHGPAISHLLAVNTRKICEEIRGSHAELQPLSQVLQTTNAPTSEEVEKSTPKSPEMQEKIIAVAPKLEDENTLSSEGQMLVSQQKEREHQLSPFSFKEALSHLKTEESMELPSDVLTHLTKSSYDIENPPARLAVWDFGGQSVYYNTHHTFLSARAIYILVIDMSLALTDRLDDQWHGAEHFSGTILDFTYYWIDAIHTYAQQQNMSEDGVSPPQIIIACTHKDKYLENVPKERHEEEINAYFAKLRHHIKQKRSGVHVDSRFFAIDNTCQDEDQEISDLRRFVMKIAESQKSWGEKNPIRWIRLEEDLQLRQAPEKRGKRWIRYEELQNLALKVGMQDAIELQSFLQFHHDIGDLMHFQTDYLTDTVILNPTWLIDAFRSIIAVDKHHVRAKGTPYWSALKRGILDERLLDELWGDDSELKPILIGVMIQFNILLEQEYDVKPGRTEKPTSRQFYVPSLLEICKNPESGVGSEGTLLIQGKENFMPHVLFNRLTVKLVQNDTSSGRKGLRRRGDFFLIKNELYYDYAVYAIDPLRRARCALRKSPKSSAIKLIPLYPATTKFDKTIRGAYAKWKNHVSMQIQQVKQTICPQLQLEWCVRDPNKPKVREELVAIDPKETDLTAYGIPEDSVYRLWFMPDSSEKEDSVTPPATTLPSDTGGNRDGGMSREQTMSKSPAPSQTRYSISEDNENIMTDALKDTFLRRFSITPEGGHVHLKEVGVFLLVPPGALAETTEMFIGISWREEDMPPLPPCQTRASPVVVCGPHGLMFRTPVYLSFYHCISGTRQRKMGEIYPENATQNSRLDNPFYIWQSETHLNDLCQWKVLSSDSAVLTNTKCVLTMNQFCKHSLSCDSKRLSALVFGSFQPQHVPLLKLMLCCVNDTRDEVENVRTYAKESLLMEMLDLAKKFQFLTCECSESEEKESYDVSLLLDGVETKWNINEDCPRKVIKYVKLLKNETEHVIYALSPKMADRLDVFVCKIHIKQEVAMDEKKVIKELTSTEFDIHWKLPHLFKTSRETSDFGESSLMGDKSLVKTTQKKREGACDHEADEDHENKEEHQSTSSPSVSNSVAHGRSGQKQSHEEGVMDNFSDKKSLRNMIETVLKQQEEILKRLKTLEAKEEERRGGGEDKVAVPPIVQDLRQGAVSGQQREKQGDANFQTCGNLVHESPPLPVTDHRLEEQGSVRFQIRRKPGHAFPSLPPQQDPVAAGDQDHDVTDRQAIRATGNQALNQAHGDNQLERLPTAVTHGIAGVLRQIPANTGNMQITLVHQVNHNYFSEKESMTHMKENDVTTSFHKHVPLSVKKQLNETLSQDVVWNQVKKMYDISDDTPCPPDIVSSLLSQVDGSIASFINVLLKLNECHREGQQDIPQSLIDEVKEGLMSEMEYDKLREKVVDFAEELSIYIGRILDYLYQFSVIPDEETTKLKNDAKRNPQEACRGLFKALLATSPKKEPIKHLKAAFRDSGLWYLADELEVS